eukprot:COSAG01_NODE_1424_length_10352_cov_3.066517_10_plen_182_part_00
MTHRQPHLVARRIPDRNAPPQLIVPHAQQVRAARCHHPHERSEHLHRPPHTGATASHARPQCASAEPHTDRGAHRRDVAHRDLRVGHGRGARLVGVEYRRVVGLVGPLPECYSCRRRSCEQPHDDRRLHRCVCVRAIVTSAPYSSRPAAPVLSCARMCSSSCASSIAGGDGHTHTPRSRKA